MEKLKNILKSDTPTDESSQTGATGKITGQGSHFPNQNEPTSTQPSTVTGTEASTRGPTDVSAVTPDPIQASSTAGPERGGSEHVTTIPAESTSTTQPTETKPEAQSYNVTNADFPRTESSVDGSGTAAIGTTTTYKSSLLPPGDPLPSVVDKDSSDPLSYKKPESGAGIVGVGAGAASVAATTAFTSSQERGQGHENPYQTTDIDPRVDGGAKSSTPGNTTDATTTHGTVAGGSLAAAGAATAYSQVTEGRSAQAQSTLTTTTDPTDRSATYSQATTSQGLDEAKPVTTSASQPADTAEEKTSMVGKVLGAVGLGGVAGAAVAKLSGDKEAVADDGSEPVTTTGITSYTSPTHQGPGTSHHRKESIPTTAYPAGADSPGAINAPIGGTRTAATESTTQSTPPVASQTSDNSTGHKAATAVAGAGAGAGAAAIGAAAVGNEHYTESKDLREDITGQQSGSAQPTTEAAHGLATTGVPHEAYTESKSLRDNATSSQTAISTATDSTQKEDDHTARNAAIGAGAGAAVAGAGVASTAEYSKKEAEKAEAEAAKQRAARQKEIEEQQKAAQKQAEKEQKVAEKEEKAHQKAVEKEEKQHQKELEKEEKKHQKEIAAAEKKHEKEEKQHQKELEKDEKERKKQAEEEVERRRQAALAASAPAAAAAADSDKKADREKDVKEEEQEKKPSLLKRIFKRRKNSTTGEEEEYEAEEEDGKDVPVAAGAAAGTVAGSAALASKGNEQPLSSTATESTPVDPLASTQPPSQAGAAGFVTTGADGKPQYTVIPQPPPDTATATTSDTRATDPLVAHDASTGTKTAEILSGSPTTANTTVGTGEHGHQSLEERIEAMTHDKFGVVDDHKR